MSKPKSPRAPSRSIADAFNFTQKLYEMYGHGKFSRSEIASTLGFSSGSGAFNTLVSTMKLFGFIDKQGLEYSVTTLFLDMKTNPRDSQVFQSRALEAIKHSKVLDDLVTSFHSKLPERIQVAHRLERDWKFTSKKASIVADVLEESLRFAGLLDSMNNILPARVSQSFVDEVPLSDEVETSIVRSDEAKPELPSTDLKIEIPLGNNRRSTIIYPPDISKEEAEKISRVLSAIAD